MTLALALVTRLAHPLPSLTVTSRRRRKALTEEIVALARDTARETGRPAFDPRVMSVLATVPRHRFVPAGEIRAAYSNRPLPIGYGQTISQPYIVALMTDLLRVHPRDVVLEIGTGSGYQAAILAELGASVCTIEIVEPLAREAAERLRVLGYATVRTRAGDGYYGWEDCGSVRRDRRHRGSAATCRLRSFDNSSRAAGW